MIIRWGIEIERNATAILGCGRWLQERVLFPRCNGVEQKGFPTARISNRMPSNRSQNTGPIQYACCLSFIVKNRQRLIPICG